MGNFNIFEDPIEKGLFLITENDLVIGDAFTTRLEGLQMLCTYFNKKRVKSYLTLPLIEKIYTHKSIPTLINVLNANTDEINRAIQETFDYYKTFHHLVTTHCQRDTLLQLPGVWESECNTHAKIFYEINLSLQGDDTDSGDICIEREYVHGDGLSTLYCTQIFEFQIDGIVIAERLLENEFITLKDYYELLRKIQMLLLPYEPGIAMKN